MDINKLTQIVNKHDLLGLISIGAPEDEYQPEISEIFCALQVKQMTEDELAEKIKAIFVKWFDEGTANISKPEGYKNLAHDILSCDSSDAIE